MTDSDSNRFTVETTERQKKIAKRVSLAVAVTASVIAVLYLLVQLVGILDTVIYTVLFLVAATGIPTTILMLGPSLPQSIRSVLGKLQWILGQLAFGYGYLLQREDRWELCPGERDRVYIDGEWHDIDGGQQHLTILGWQPFGIIRYKEAGSTLQAERVDPETVGIADGGVTRAGFAEATPTATNKDWLVDLKPIYSRGLQQVGDIDLIEKVEEITMRKQAKEGTFSGWEPIIASAIGLVLGILTGYVMLVGV